MANNFEEMKENSVLKVISLIFPLFSFIFQKVLSSFYESILIYVLFLINLLMLYFVREVSARVHGEGAKMMDADDRVWELWQILFADDTALMADSEEKLQKLVEEFG